MLEYLKLESNAYFTMYFVEITCDNGILKVKYGDIFGSPFLEIKLPAAMSKKTLKKIEDLHLEKWKSDYQLPEHLNVCDGETWELEYKVAGKRCRHMSGYVEHPQNWAEFLFVLSEISPVEAPLQLEKFEFQYDFQLECLSTHDLNYLQQIRPKPQKCREKISIDAKKNLLFVERKVGKEQVMRYELQDKFLIRGILDDIACELDECDDANFQNPKNKEYSLKLEYLCGKKQHFYGPYNRAQLPEDWTNVLEILDMSIDNVCELCHGFRHKTYGYGVKEGEYILCSVAFEKSPKTYYYLTEDDSIRPNNKVEVLVGNAEVNEEVKTVVVKKVEYFTAEKLPMPLEKIKKIIRKIV